MKVRFYIATAAVLLSAFLAGCYKDDSSEIDEMIPNIQIEDFEPLYTIESYAGNKLVLDPVVNTEYKDSELTYNWYLIDRQAEKSDNGEKYVPEHIAAGKHLEYEINVAPGDYNVLLEVKASNGYEVTKLVELRVVTGFSQGFYILKETPDGYTDLDLFSPETDVRKENIFASRNGEPLKARPGYLSMSFNHSYIDPQTHATAGANMLTITTLDGRIRVMRTSDLKEVLNNDNLLFESFEEGEVPYRIVTCMWLNALLTNKGIRSQYESTMHAGGTGQYGLTNGVAASPWVEYNPEDMGLYFWDGTTNSICHCNYNGTITVGSDENYKIDHMRYTECMHVGYNRNKNSILFVTRNTLNNGKQIYRLVADFSAGYKVESVTSLKDMKMNEAIDFTTCAKSAGYLYGLMGDGTIWALDFMEGIEKEITFKGIPADEKVTYISDKSYGVGHIYFIVGTTKGDTYTLRFYSLLGGMPDGEPLYTVSGTGTVKSVQYTSGKITYVSMPPMQN